MVRVPVRALIQAQTQVLALVLGRVSVQVQAQDQVPAQAPDPGLDQAQVPGLDQAPAPERVLVPLQVLAQALDPGQAQDQALVPALVLDRVPPQARALALDLDLGQVLARTQFQLPLVLHLGWPILR